MSTSLGTADLAGKHRHNVSSECDIALNTFQCTPHKSRFASDVLEPAPQILSRYSPDIPNT